MNKSFGEWPNSIDNNHKDKRGRFSFHVFKEVFGQIMMEEIVYPVTWETDNNADEENRNGENLKRLGEEVKTEGNFQRSITEKGEIFNIALEDNLNEHEFEGVVSEEFTDFIVEQTEEDAIEEEEENQIDGHKQDEEVKSAANEQIVLPLFQHVSRIGISIVFWDNFHGIFNIIDEFC